MLKSDEARAPACCTRYMKISNLPKLLNPSCNRSIPSVKYFEHCIDRWNLDICIYPQIYEISRVDLRKSQVICSELMNINFIIFIPRLAVKPEIIDRPRRP